MDLTTQPESKQNTILIVDDNPMNLGVIADYLEDQGFTILVARDGNSALEKADYARPDIILLDVMMPGIDGFETCRRLKENPVTAPIPVIFMTALAETENKVKGFTAGAVDYVTKPIQQEEVLARITTHLRLRELTERLEQLVEERTAELNSAYHNLARLDKAKSDFIVVTSHELRTPLTVIDSSTQVLKSHPQITENEDLQPIVDTILRGTTRMSKIVKNILDATKIDQDSLTLVKEEMSLATTVEAMHDSFKEVLEQRRLTLMIDGFAGLPFISADPEMIYNLFQHLLTNAIKYTPDGGQIDLRAQSITTEDGQTQIEVTVTDSGIGIAADDIELIFEKFYQTGQSDLHSSGTTGFKSGGPGLGLAIARGITEAHGGQIWASSDGYDEVTYPGSRFYVRLPIA